MFASSKAAAAEDWVIAKADGTCLYANDMADQAAEPAFASPFKLAALGADIKIHRSEYSGEIDTVDVILDKNKHVLYFAEMANCVQAQRSLHHQE